MVCNNSITHRWKFFKTKVIQSSLSLEPIIGILHSVVDTKGWMQGVTTTLHGHLKAHQIWFKRDESGECKMHYKEWSTDILSP